MRMSALRDGGVYWTVHDVLCGNAQKWQRVKRRYVVIAINALEGYVEARCDFGPVFRYSAHAVSKWTDREPICKNKLQLERQRGQLIAAI